MSLLNAEHSPIGEHGSLWPTLPRVVHTENIVLADMLRVLQAPTELVEILEDLNEFSVPRKGTSPSPFMRGCLGWFSLIGGMSKSHVLDGRFGYISQDRDIRRRLSDYLATPPQVIIHQSLDELWLNPGTEHTIYIPADADDVQITETMRTLDNFVANKVIVSVHARPHPRIDDWLDHSTNWDIVESTKLPTKPGRLFLEPYELD